MTNSIDWNNIPANRIADLKRICDENSIKVAVPRGKAEYVEAVTAWYAANGSSAQRSPASRRTRNSPSPGRVSPVAVAKGGTLQDKISRAAQNPGTIVAIVLFLGALILLFRA
jgi:hypothetical protein